MGIGDEKLKAISGRVAVGIIPTAYLVLFFGLPLAALVFKVFNRTINYSSENLVAGIEIAVGALPQVLMSATLSLVVGMPLAGLIANYTFPGKELLKNLALVPFVLPTLVTGLAIRTLFANLLEPGLWLLVIAHVYVNLAVVIRVVGAAWENIDRRYLIIAKTLDKSPTEIFREVTLPLLWPSIARAFGLISIFTFGSLGLAIVVGGNQRTLETQLLRQISLLVDFDAAAVTAALQLVSVVFLLLITQIWKVQSGNPNVTLPSKLPNRLKWLVLVYFGVFLLPIGWLFLQSFKTSTGFGLSNWVLVLADFKTWQSVASSMSIALIAAIIAVVMGTLVSFASRKIAFRRLSGIFSLPLAVSSVTLGLSLLISNRMLESFILPQWILPSIAHSLVALPFAIAILLPPITNLSENWLTLAGSLGASTARAYSAAFSRILEVALPAAFAFGMAISLGEFGAASFLANPENPTLSVLLSRLISKPSAESFAMASVIAVLLALVTLLLTSIFQKSERRENV